MKKDIHDQFDSKIEAINKSGSYLGVAMSLCVISLATGIGRSVLEEIDRSGEDRQSNSQLIIDGGSDMADPTDPKDPEGPYDGQIVSADMPLKNHPNDPECKEYDDRDLLKLASTVAEVRKNLTRIDHLNFDLEKRREGISRCILHLGTTIRKHPVLDPQLPIKVILDWDSPRPTIEYWDRSSIPVSDLL